MKELLWVQQLHQQHQQSETFYKGPKQEEQQDYCQCTPTFLNDLYQKEKEFQFKEVWRPGEAERWNNEEPKLNSGKCGISIGKGTIPNHSHSENVDDDVDEEKATSNCCIFVEQRNLEAFHLNEGKSTENNFLSPTTRIASLPTTSCPITELNHYHWQYPIGKNRSSSSAPLATVAILEKTSLLASPTAPAVPLPASESKTFCGSGGGSNAEKDDNADDDHPDCRDDGENKSSWRGSGVISYFPSISNDDKAAITNNEQTTVFPFIDNEHSDTSCVENSFAVPRLEWDSTDIHGLLVDKRLGLVVDVAVGPSDSEIEHNEPGTAERMVKKSFPSSNPVLPLPPPSPPVQLLSLFSSSVASPSTKPPSSNSESTKESNRSRKRRASGYVTHKSAAFLLNLLLFLYLSHDRLLSGAEAGNIPLGVVFEQGSAEIQSAFAYALTTFTPLNISNVPRDKFAFNAYVDTINTADAFKLSKLICNQFFRGVYAIVGSMNSESFQTFHSYANTFQMPIVTPGFPTKPRKVSKFQVHQSLSLNSAMDFVSRGENSTVSPLVRSPLINDTFQKLLDSATESSADESGSRDVLIEKLVEEIVAKESGRLDFVTKIRPDLHQAILDITAHYGWRNVIYLFHSNEGLLRLQSIFEKQGFKNDSIRVRVMKRISSVMDALSIIRNIEVAQRFQPKHIILDCPASLAKDIIISHVRDLHLGRRTYHYLIAGLAFDEPWERSVVEFTAVNITGFRMVDPDRKLVKDFLSRWATLDTNQFEGGGKRYISATAALMYDGMLVIKEAFTSILRENPNALHREKGRNLTCNSGVDFLNPIVPFEHGRLINERLRRVEAEGLTGHIEFNRQGSRKNFTVDVIEITLENGQTKVGEWSDVSGFVTAQQLSDPLSKRKKPDTNREYIVTSILEEPYLMLKKAEKGENLTGNDQYEGFCKDLADLIAKNMNIKYKLMLVRDKKYGSENPTAPGGWDGMIGELIRHEADMAISSLTITAQRETVVDFSMDFMEAGISIMIKKPQTELPGAFSFVKPMRSSIWFASFAAVVVVASVLLVVQGKPNRHSDSHSANTSDAASTDSSQITFPNTLWFSIASVFRQSTPFTPRRRKRLITQHADHVKRLIFQNPNHWGVVRQLTTDEQSVFLQNKGFCQLILLSLGWLTQGSQMLSLSSCLVHFSLCKCCLPENNEADVSIAPLTITAERERVVDFTKPFLNLGISIMFYKPKKANSGVFGFMSPLSTNTWYCVIVAYIGVSFVLYIVSRCNPTEWITETEGMLHNQFSFPNALWFSFAALVQQGSDLSPRSFAGRLVGSVWWFFTLILISSYTANFAAVRTVNRMVLPIKSAKDLSEQSEIQYGTLLGGSTYEFFRRSEVPVYKRMFEFMSGPNQLNVKSYDDGIKLVREKKGKYALLIESPKNDYTNQRKPCDTMKVGPNLDSKGFGIGTPLGSPLKHQINLEVLRLKENGILNKLESKWWFERSECDVTNKQETATGDEELSLGSLAGIFYILIIGLVLSMVVSFLEFCYNSKKEAQKSKLTLTEAMKKKAKNTITGPLPSSNGNDPVTCIH